MLCGQPQTVAGPQDELRMEFEEKKQELFDLCVEMRATGAFTKLSWKDMQNFRLTTHLAAQMEPRPHDSTWYNIKHMHTYAQFCFQCLDSFSYVSCRRMYRGYRTFHDFQYAYFCLGFLAYSFLGKDKKKDEENIEANILSDTVPATE